MKSAEEMYLALLNIAATGRKWAVAQGGSTPLAIIAGMARDALGMTTEEIDEACKRYNEGEKID
jgi:hypothetical protein